MAQILTGPTAGQQQAQLFLSPVLQSLQNLTSMQLRNIEQQKKRSETLAGLSQFMSPEQSELFSYLPPYLQFSLLSKRGGNLLGNMPGARKLNEQQAQEILAASGGNKAMARKLAKSMGYSF